MKHVVFIGMACVVALLFCGSARAISTLEDTIRNAPRLFRIPSTVPPNNAVHRNFNRLRQQPRSDTPSDSEPVTPDQGPAPEDMPVTVPGSSAPWAVAVSESAKLDEDFLCAGVLIDPSWVLTAAHCMFFVARRWPNDTRPYVFTGSANLAAPGPKAAIEEIVVHPKYDPRTLQNDLVLLKIDSTNTKSTPIKFEGPPITEQVGQIATILGWGITTSFFNLQHREKLQLIQTAVMDDSLCFSAANFPTLRKTGVFCGRSLLKYHDVCFRFGGSPLAMYDNKGGLYLAGLVSWSAVCPAEARKPNVYLDIHFHAPWIKSVIGGRVAQPR